MFWHTLSDAVHVLRAQHASPVLPHAPLWQPPAEHVPCVPGHVPWSATQVDCTQQPLFEHVFPSQQAWPEPPHVVHVPIEQASDESVQKSAALPPPAQQG